MILIKHLNTFRKPSIVEKESLGYRHVTMRTNDQSGAEQLTFNLLFSAQEQISKYFIEFLHTYFHNSYCHNSPRYTYIVQKCPSHRLIKHFDFFIVCLKLALNKITTMCYPVASSAQTFKNVTDFRKIKKQLDLASTELPKV